ncbi:hypothetical protein [Pedobacter soli]|uniref:Uncharacterized protein n=1 Tax=Pedobacter soli TaxID=390242 RepID=A0A1G6WVL8_9SPHI|nr:hypothetical protein [Pedobacter soli]SDD69990.1 hypothetical protein SAMN04488024_107139 [Pedobacter soli]
MEKLIAILKQQLEGHRVSDIVKVGDSELRVVVDTREDFIKIRRMAELTHDDSEVKIKGITIQFVDIHGLLYQFP